MTLVTLENDPQVTELSDLPGDKLLSLCKDFDTELEVRWEWSWLDQSILRELHL